MQILKTFFLIGFIFLAFQLEAQDKKNISYGAEGNVNMFTYVFKEVGLAENDYRLNGSIGGSIYLQIAEHLNLKSGLNLHFINLGRNDFGITFPCDIDPQNGINQNSSHWADVHRSFYIGIPLEVIWDFNQNKKNGFYLNLGQELLFKLKNNLTFGYTECGNFVSLNSSDPPYQFSNFLILAKFGIGYQFKINEKNTIYFQSNIQYSVNALIKDGILTPFNYRQEDRHILNAGISVGIKF